MAGRAHHHFVHNRIVEEKPLLLLLYDPDNIRGRVMATECVGKGKSMNEIA
jgi:hypothetical protein